MSGPAPLAVSLGDPAGVGPELIAQAWAVRDAEALPPFLAIGGAEQLRAAAAARGLDIAIETTSDPARATGLFATALPVLDVADGAYNPGSPDPDGARLALESLRLAAQLALAGNAGGIVTAPIAKALMAQVGFEQPGQTEFVADMCNVPRNDTAMMLAGPSLRTVPLTIHVALADVPAHLSTDLIVQRTRVVWRALRTDFGIERPRLAICGLNPHAGEDGKFGTEERAVIAPAIERLAGEGIAIDGPLPSDTAFAPRLRESYDAVLCMYHDQALIPVKALDFDSAVNITLGLPIVRTAPDHGTAFDIAGKRQAHPGAMIAAIRMAGECAARRASR